MDKALTESGARNNIAVKALLAAFLRDAKVGEDGSVKGLAAEIETLAKGESTSFLFDNTKGAVIKGMKPGEAGDGAGYGGEVNPFAAKTFDLEARANCSAKTRMLPVRLQDGRQINSYNLKCR